MIVHLHAEFKKQFKKLRPAEQEKFRARRDMFMADPTNPILNNHPLQGKYEGCRSISITGDIRVVFKMINDDTAYFIDIGTHHRLYGK